MRVLNRLIELGRVDSTNSYARKLLMSGYAWEGDIIVSDEQTDGYGKEKRDWFSPKGGLYISFILPELCKRDGLMPFLALIVAETLNQFGIGTALKWPNDIIHEDKKLGGILAESVGNHIIVGIGINTFPRELIPNELTVKATTIELTKERKEELLRMLIANFNKTLPKFIEGGFSPFVERWNSYSFNLNREVKIRDNNNLIQGVFRGIDKEGAMILDTDDGKIVMKRGELIIG